jgi:uncharacterized protein
VQLWAGTSTDFILDATRNAVAAKLEKAFRFHYHYAPAHEEVVSWQNSLFRMAFALQTGGFIDHGVQLEYQLPLSSKRLDCMVTGNSPEGQPYGVIVELKQWTQAKASNADDCVVVWVAGRERDVLHPSRQVGQYQEYLRDMHNVFSKGEVGLRSCVYLHNFTYDAANELFSDRHKHLRELYPTFAGDQVEELLAYMGEHLHAGGGIQVLERVLNSKFGPSKKLLEHTANVVNDQRSFVLLDIQAVVFEKVLAEARDGAKASKIKKTVMLVHGGPGTGKSVIALHLLGRLAGENRQVLHVTGSKAFTQNLRKVVGGGADALFKYFNLNRQGECLPNQFDVLILDEAHRIRESSRDRFMPANRGTGLPQIDELVNIAKVLVFFIDDKQVVRRGEVGSSELIRAAAARHNAHLLEYELDAQFRCSGSDGFINWINNTLDIERTANVMWDEVDPYEFRVVDSVEELDKRIREKAADGQSARLCAGFCWPWSNPKPDGTLAPDVRVGAWQMPWNAKAEAGRLAAGIPKSDYWASDPRGLEQVGCIYTAQGFEFDYAGVIFGPDLRYDAAQAKWVGDRSKSRDSGLPADPVQFLELVKNTYRVLLTRGIKGCYVYFMDEATRNFVRSRMEKST